MRRLLIFAWVGLWFLLAGCGADEPGAPTAVFPEPTTEPALAIVTVESGATPAAAATIPILTPLSHRESVATLTPVPPTVTVTPLPTATPTALPLPIQYGYRVLQTYPHDPDAFTQGLVWDEGVVYEGTGLNGRSSLRRVDLETGEVLQMISLDDLYFGEGITVFGDRIIQLTWRSRVGFVYDKESLEQLNAFGYEHEGWGITHDGERLIVSDGTPILYFWDPDTLTEIGRVQVRDGAQPVARLNELEYVNGEIWANVWLTPRIARIDPATGLVTGWIDLTGLPRPEEITQPIDVLNGIMVGDNGRIFITGKLWPTLYEIELVPSSASDN